ncbi:MAG: HNH endonuclease [Methanoregulaceae archaeon]|jgi:hypothetical protein|nr:HNH endonuclease [Methanoregulaceae archaeon]
MNGSRNSPKYELFRDSCLIRDDFKCRKCGANCNLEVHHIKPYHANRQITTHPGNGITLCEDCHKKFHNLYGRKSCNLKDILEFLDRPSLKSSNFATQNNTPTNPPRIVTPSQIALFERLNPALKGIGDIMVEMGLWVIVSGGHA